MKSKKETSKRNASRVRYLQQRGVIQCLCHEAVMTCDIFSLRLACSCAAISLLTVSRFRLTEDPDTWEGLGVYKQDLRGRQARKIHPLAFRGVYLRSALEQCIPEQSDRRCSQLRRLNVLFFCFSRATNADCRVSRLMFSLIWWSRHNSSVQQRVKLILNHLTPAKKHNRIILAPISFVLVFCGTPILRPCVSERVDRFLLHTFARNIRSQESLRRS